jgi:hypothetical protein
VLAVEAHRAGAQASQVQAGAWIGEKADGLLVDLTATASMSGNADELRAIFDAGGRPEFEVVADITDADGTVTGRLRTRWTLKALKRA